MNDNSAVRLTINITQCDISEIWLLPCCEEFLRGDIYVDRTWPERRIVVTVVARQALVVSVNHECMLLIT